jgi:Uma2 family endonuclease
MSSAAFRRATIDDLLATEGKAELIGGRVARLMPSGFTPSQVAFDIAVSLREYVRATGQGFAFADGMGFTVPELPSGRESFCPDASYYDGPLPANLMRFVEGPPAFAVEVRSEHDYGPAAERALAAKRADTFAAGALVVWDVDPQGRGRPGLPGRRPGAGRRVRRRPGGRRRARRPRLADGGREALRARLRGVPGQVA